VKRGQTVYEMQGKPSGGGKTAPAPPAQTPDAATPARDRVGLPVRADAAPAFALTSDFEAAEKLHAQLTSLVDELAQGAAGAAYRLHLVRRIQDGKATFYSPELHVFAQKLTSAAPHCGYCPRCHAKHAGRTHPSCTRCGGRGWLTRAEFDACPQNERQELERWR
jgi:hypothetical protein